MPLDHYVSQTHITKFYSPKLGEAMYAIRKNNPLKVFITNAKSVCRIENGSTNPYLREERIIEEFLKEIEPKYNDAIKKLEDDKIDAECIYVIAGFIAYIITCSPAGMRIQSGPLESSVSEISRIIDAKGLYPPPPPELGYKSLTELIDTDKVRVEVDPKYPQAIGISSIILNTLAFGNFTWEVLINPYKDESFFTSDFPVAVEETEDIRVLNRIVPLSPNLAIRIRPNISFDMHNARFSFSNFHYVIKRLSRSEMIKINRLIIRCAESMVFFRDDYEWIPRFIKRNAGYRIEQKTSVIPYGEGTFLHFSQEVSSANYDKSQ